LYATYPLDYHVWAAMLERYHKFQPKLKNIDEQSIWVSCNQSGMSFYRTQSTRRCWALRRDWECPASQTWPSSISGVWVTRSPHGFSSWTCEKELFGTDTGRMRCRWPSQQCRSIEMNSEHWHYPVDFVLSWFSYWLIGRWCKQKRLKFDFNMPSCILLYYLYYGVFIY